MGSTDASVAFFARADKYLMTTGVPSSPVVITKAKGTRLYDANNRQILDFTSGQMSSLLGHSHPEIVDVVTKYVAELDHLLSNMITHPVVDLAERLARFLPSPLEKSFFLNTGSESTEAAIKMAKYYTGNFEIVAFAASYHGLTQGSGSATYSAGRRKGGPCTPGQLAFPAPYAYRSPFRAADGSYYQARHPNAPRKSPAKARKNIQSTLDPPSPRSQLEPDSSQQQVFTDRDTSLRHPLHSGLAVSHQEILPHGEESRVDGNPNLIGIVAEAGDDSSHVISPAVADDNEILQNYLSATPLARRRAPVRPSAASSRPMRPVRFNIVRRRPLGVTANQTPAESKCEMIEKYMDPFVDEYLNLFFAHANPCFPIFDEVSFRSAYSAHKGNISHALLCNLYANSLIYWRNSPKLRSGRTPDIRFIWNLANEALHSELFLSPGISTVMSIIINVCGRPSTSMFGNGGMVGTAVALSNALGLNRDPSGWNISSLEKSLRIRIWWLVVIHDRWCSLAYGTPLQIHRGQCDVPFPAVNDICSAYASPQQKTAASVFVAFVTLTEVLACYLEHVYNVSNNHAISNEMSATTLEQILRAWEESLDHEARRVVLRGTHLEVPGTANFRLAYLAVKLLLRRIQLDLSKESGQLEDDVSSPIYVHAQRAAEDIAHFLHELDESQFCGFWVPVHAFSLTSAAMFLLRSGLRLRHQNRNIPLKTAKDMIRMLQVHRHNFDWDLADNCLAHCGELVERIGTTEVDNETSAPEFLDSSEGLELDPSVLEKLFFEISGFAEGLGFAEGMSL